MWNSLKKIFLYVCIYIYMCVYINSEESCDFISPDAAPLTRQKSEKLGAKNVCLMVSVLPLLIRSWSPLSSTAAQGPGFPSQGTLCCSISSSKCKTSHLCKSGSCLVSFEYVSPDSCLWNDWKSKVASGRFLNSRVENWRLVYWPLNSTPHFIQEMLDKCEYIFQYCSANVITHAPWRNRGKDGGVVNEKPFLCGWKGEGEKIIQRTVQSVLSPQSVSHRGEKCLCW